MKRREVVPCEGPLSDDEVVKLGIVSERWCFDDPRELTSKESAK